MNKLEDLNTISFFSDGMCRMKMPYGEVARPLGKIIIRLGKSGRIDYNVIAMTEILAGTQAPYSVVLHRKHVIKTDKGDELWAYASVWDPESGENGVLRLLGPIMDIRFIDPSAIDIIGPHTTKKAA